MTNRKPYIRRAPGWSKLRDAHLRKHPTCAACGSRKHLIVHHIVPVHVDPTQELEAGNLLTLCEGPTVNCHLAVGHLLLYRSWNASAIEDAAWFLRRVKERPRR